ncbi:MAG: hypothetical protein ACRYG5_02605 [Janthinobacterium lividum]
MKPLAARLMFCIALAATGSAGAQALPQGASTAPTAEENAAAGLPDLQAVNRSPVVGSTATATVDVNSPREPSFYLRDKNGTEVQEFRDRGKATEIDVHSNFGTRYRMTTPTDTSPQIQNSGPPAGRVPSVHLSY